MLLSVRIKIIVSSQTVPAVRSGRTVAAMSW
jgi:hypothetical protein